MSSSSPAPLFSLPVARHKLANGIRILLLPRPLLPVVSISVLIKVGAIMEREKEAGLASLTAGLLTAGTMRRDAVTLAEDVDALGAMLGVHSDYDYTILGLNCLSRHLSEGIDTAAEVLTTPAFAEAELERRRSDVLSFLARKKDDPSYQIRNRFIGQTYGRHPYGHPREGTGESIPRILATTLRDFYERFYRPECATIALVGDFDTSAALEALSLRFGTWSVPPAIDPEIPPIPVRHGFQVDRMQKDGMNQATVRLGGLGIHRNSPDFVPAMLMNHILGGSGLGSRLMLRLREEKGLTYGVSSNLHVLRLAGTFFVECQTSYARTTDALREILGELKRLRRDGVGDEELEGACRFFTGSLPLSFQTNDQISTRLLEQDLFGLEEEFWHREIEKMRTTTKDEILDLARRLLDPETFSLIVLADFRQAGPIRSDLDLAALE